MENKKLLMGTAMVALSAIALPQKAEAVTAAVGINAQIYDALAVGVVTNLDFGTFTYQGAGTLDITNGGVATDGANINSIGASTTSTGTVNITKNAGASVVFTGPAGSITLNHTVTGTQTMKVNGFECDAVDAVCTTAVAGTAGSMSYGATLNVAGTEASGNYTGSFNVTIAYQ